MDTTHPLTHPPPSTYTHAQRMAGTILDFYTKQESQDSVQINSKFSSWSGSFGSETRKATFGKLDDFKKGLDRHLGMPSFNVRQQMYREHCTSNDSHTMFRPPNNKEIETCPAWEYDFVVNYDAAKEYPGGNERVGGVVHVFMKHKNAKKSGLTEDEVIGLRLYSGPMYIFYNTVLRGGVRRYITTIHAIVSGIIKLSSIMKLPFNRKVYRGLSGYILPAEFWMEDEYGAKGGVEFGIMSTTTDKVVAIQYSSHGRVPTIFEIEIGQVDRGAELKWISQFPGEEEVVMPPLSNLEVIGAPYLTRFDGATTQVLVVPLRVNVNIKSKTMGELVATRKDVLLSAVKDLQVESEQEISALAQAMGEINALLAGQEPEWFNDQVSHRHVNEEKSADSQNQLIMLKRRRKDLWELVATTVDAPNLQIKQVADEIVSLEKWAWYQTSNSDASTRKRGSIATKQAECKEFTKKNALKLQLAKSLCFELEKSTKTGLEQDPSDNASNGTDDIYWQEWLVLCTNMVRAIDVGIPTSEHEALGWHKGEACHVDFLPIDIRQNTSVAAFFRRPIVAVP